MMLSVSHHIEKDVPHYYVRMESQSNIPPSHTRVASLSNAALGEGRLLPESNQATPRTGALVGEVISLTARPPFLSRSGEPEGSLDAGEHGIPCRRETRWKK